ncbi:MAG TPA: discoidin domain-containing protein [Nitrososphaeraceae archaeon]|nr:discoidin domain-containing protein [Nitrososphaeraceae archaeon]
MITNYENYENKMFKLMFILFFTLGILFLSNIYQIDNVDAQIGKFGTFTGNNFKYIKDSEAFQLDKFSIAAWFKTSNTDPSVSFIINKGGFGSEAQGENMNYGMWLTYQGHLQAGFEATDSSNYFVTTKKPVNDNKWHYAIVTYDGSILKLFIDGVLDASLNTDNSKPDNTGDNRIAIAANSLYKDKLYLGDVDEVRIWNRALTTAEVHDAFTENKFNLDGQLVFVSFGDNTSCKPEEIVDVRSIGNNGDDTVYNVIDGNPSTHWSKYGLDSWIELDLGSEKEICDVDISWYKGDQRNYKFMISTSSDGEIFSNLYSGTSNVLTNGLEKFDIPDIKTRFLKITVNDNSMNNWSGISDVSINNPTMPGSPSPCPLLKIPPSHVTSLGSSLVNPVENLVDNNPSTKWSNLGLGSWIQFDLGQEKQICDIGISWYKGDIRDIDFIVSVSSDGDEFRQIFSSSNSLTTDEIEVYDIPDTVAKYLRITVTGNNMNNWASINEINLFGKPIQKESLTLTSLNIITQVINDNGGKKQSKDFDIIVKGTQPTPESFPGNPDGKYVSLQPGKYDIQIANPSEYETTLSAGCTGKISLGENRECVITLDDRNPAKLLEAFPNTIEAVPAINNNLTTNNLSTTPTTNNLSTTLTNGNLNNDKINTKPELKILSAKPVLNVLLEVLNIHGGNKKPADFMISVNGQGVNPITFAGSNDFKKVEIDAGNYDVKINDKYGYEINRVSGCTGMIERTDKTCIIELIDTPEILNTTEVNSSINKIE